MCGVCCVCQTYSLYTLAACDARLLSRPMFRLAFVCVHFVEPLIFVMPMRESLCVCVHVNNLVRFKYARKNPTRIRFLKWESRRSSFHWVYFQLINLRYDFRYMQINRKKVDLKINTCFR